MALLSGRRRQSKQTGFIHHCPESSWQNPLHDTIPLLENFSFALALFRSRLAENVLEGKALLEKLLPFEVEGNYPIYLHEYPQCKRKSLSQHILPYLHWIYTDFHPLLGEELREKVKACLERIEALPKEPIGKITHSPTKWADFLIALQMSSSSIDEGVKAAAAHWHPSLLAYIGSPAQLFQEKEQPALTLYDLFMGELFQRFPQRALVDHPIHLQSAIIRPFGEHETPSFSEKNYHSQIENNHFALLWGDANHLHSLTCRVSEAHTEARLYSRDPDGSPERELVYDFSPNVAEDEEQKMELALYCDRHPENALFVNGKQANVFYLDDLVEIVSKKSRIQLRFSLNKGEGVFMGHLFPANRPSQISREDRFAAYDWKIALRTLKRSAGCSVKISMQVVLF